MSVIGQIKKLEKQSKANKIKVANIVREYLNDETIQTVSKSSLEDYVIEKFANVSDSELEYAYNELQNYKKTEDSKTPITESKKVKLSFSFKPITDIKKVATARKIDWDIMSEICDFMARQANIYQTQGQFKIQAETKVEETIPTFQNKHAFVGYPENIKEQIELATSGVDKLAMAYCYESGLNSVADKVKTKAYISLFEPKWTSEVIEGVVTKTAGVQKTITEAEAYDFAMQNIPLVTDNISSFEDFVKFMDESGYEVGTESGRRIWFAIEMKMKDMPISQQPIENKPVEPTVNEVKPENNVVDQSAEQEVALDSVDGDGVKPISINKSKKNIKMATGEMAQSEVEEGGDWYEAGIELQEVANNIGKSMGVIVGKPRAFDQYQGIYILVGGWKLWFDEIPNSYILEKDDKYIRGDQDTIINNLKNNKFDIKSSVNAQTVPSNGDKKTLRIYQTIENSNKKNALKLYKEIDNFDNFQFWSGAKDNIKSYTEEEKKYLFDLCEEMFADGCTETQLNDFIWFDSGDTLIEAGYRKSEDEENVEASKKNSNNKVAGESLGWVVESDEAWDKWELWKQQVGGEEAGDDLARALGNNELADNLAYIFRMNDFQEGDSNYKKGSSKKNDIKKKADDNNPIEKQVEAGGATYTVTYRKTPTTTEIVKVVNEKGTEEQLGDDTAKREMFIELVNDNSKESANHDSGATRRNKRMDKIFEHAMPIYKEQERLMKEEGLSKEDAWNKAVETIQGTEKKAESYNLTDEDKETVKKIIKNFNPIAVKYNGNNDDGYSVLIKDKNSDFESWMDVWVDGKDVDVDWNQYIYHTDIIEDVMKRKIEDDTETVFDLTSSEAVNFLQDKGILVQDDNANWAYGKDIKNTGGKEAIKGEEPYGNRKQTGDLEQTLETSKMPLGKDKEATEKQAVGEEKPSTIDEMKKRPKTDTGYTEKGVIKDEEIKQIYDLAKTEKGDIEEIKNRVKLATDSLLEQARLAKEKIEFDSKLQDKIKKLAEYSGLLYDKLEVAGNVAVDVGDKLINSYNQINQKKTSGTYAGLKDYLSKQGLEGMIEKYESTLETIETITAKVVEFPATEKDKKADSNEGGLEGMIDSALNAMKDLYAEVRGLLVDGRELKSELVVSANVKKKSKGTKLTESQIIEKLKKDIVSGGFKGTIDDFDKFVAESVYSEWMDNYSDGESDDNDEQWETIKDVIWKAYIQVYPELDDKGEKEKTEPKITKEYSVEFIDGYNDVYSSSGFDTREEADSYLKKTLARSSYINELESDGVREWKLMYYETDKNKNQIVVEKKLKQGYI